MSAQPPQVSNRISSDQNELDFVCARFPDHDADIRRLCCDPDFQELCEHLTHVCRLEDDTSDAELSRFVELRKNLEHELIEWIALEPH